MEFGLGNNVELRNYLAYDFWLEKIVFEMGLDIQNGCPSAKL